MDASSEEVIWFIQINKRRGNSCGWWKFGGMYLWYYCLSKGTWFEDTKKWEIYLFCYGMPIIVPIGLIAFGWVYSPFCYT